MCSVRGAHLGDISDCQRSRGGGAAIAIAVNGGDTVLSPTLIGGRFSEDRPCKARADNVLASPLCTFDGVSHSAGNGIPFNDYLLSFNPGTDVSGRRGNRCIGGFCRREEFERSSMVLPAAPNPQP